MISPVCVAEHLTFCRGKKPILNDLSFAVQAGRITGLFGENGAGKSTLIKLILGILPADSGSLAVLGDSPGVCPMRIGYLPENVRFYEHLTVREHLEFFSRLKGVSLDKAEELMQRLAITPFAYRFPNTCSKGQMQRAGLAQALLTDPEFLLLDEPTSGLDPGTVTALYEELRTMAKKGCAVLVCTHELALAEHYIDAALILKGGSLAARGESIAELTQASGLMTRIFFKNPVDLGHPAVGSLEGGTLRVRPQDTGEAIRFLTQEKGIFDFTVTAPSLSELFARCCSGREGS